MREETIKDIIKYMAEDIERNARIITQEDIESNKEGNKGCNKERNKGCNKGCNKRNNTHYKIQKDIKKIVKTDNIIYVKTKENVFKQCLRYDTLDLAYVPIDKPTRDIKLNCEDIIRLKDYIFTITKNNILFYYEVNGITKKMSNLELNNKNLLLSVDKVEHDNALIILMNDFVIGYITIINNKGEIDFKTETFEDLPLTYKVFKGNKYNIFFHGLNQYTIFNVKDNEVHIYGIELDKYIINIHNHDDKLYVITKSHELKVYDIFYDKENIIRIKLLTIISLEKDVKLTSVMDYNNLRAVYKYEDNTLLIVNYSDLSIYYTLPITPKSNNIKQMKTIDNIDCLIVLLENGELFSVLLVKPQLNNKNKKKSKNGKKITMKLIIKK